MLMKEKEGSKSRWYSRSPWWRIKI